MYHTEEQKARFKAEFATRRRRQRLMAIPVIVMFVLMLASRGEEALAGIPADVVSGATIVVVLGVAVFSWRNWRCPACDRYLGRNMDPRFCAKCGVELV